MRSPMRCPTERLASAFPSLPADLDDHVAGCGACRDAWGGYQALAEVVAALADPPEPNQLRLRRSRRALLARVRLRAATPARRLRPSRRVVGLAAAAAVLLAGGSVLRSQIERRRQESPATRDPVLRADSTASRTGAAAPRAPSASDVVGGGPSAGEPGGPATSGRDPSAAGASTGRDRRIERLVPGARPPFDRWPAASPPIEIIRDRWSLLRLAPPYEGPAGPRTRNQARPWSPIERGGGPGAPSVAAGRIDQRPGGLPGGSSGDPGDGSGGEPGGEPGGGPGGDDGDRPGGTPDDGSTCADGLQRSFSGCAAAHGLDPDSPGSTEEELATLAACWGQANVGFEQCCADAPDQTCDSGPTDPSPPAGTTCADLLFSTNDQCLLDSGIDDPTTADSPAELEAMSHCWIDVANGAFDDCCAAAPDVTCP